MVTDVLTDVVTDVVTDVLAEQVQEVPKERCARPGLSGAQRLHLSAGEVYEVRRGRAHGDRPWE